MREYVYSIKRKEYFDKSAKNIPKKVFKISFLNMEIKYNLPWEVKKWE
ncbi:hypothetical protein bcgnr5393_08650 [Bacillus cereus]